MLRPVLPLGLPFAPTAVSADWFDWPVLPDLFPALFPGVKTSRDGFLVDVDLDRLKARVGDYFNAEVSHEEIARRYPGVMKDTARFNARAVRAMLLVRGGPNEAGFLCYAYRPFDTRWLYWEAETKLLDEKRADYKPHVFAENAWLVSQKMPRRAWSPPQVISHIGCIDLMDRSATCIPVWLQDNDLGSTRNNTGRRPNLSSAAQRYLDRLGLGVEDLFHHVLAVLHDPAYHEANAGALRMDWPRIPLPGWPTPGNAGILPISDAVEVLAQSAAHGRQLAALLDPETPVPGVTTGTLRPDIAVIAVPATVDGHNMTGDDFTLTDGQGRIVERAYTPEERATLGDALHTLGEMTFDIYLNSNAYWCNVPAAVWRYTLGGYQVLKKWLSYRERPVLGRALCRQEVWYFTEVARRIAVIVLLTDNRVGRRSEA